MFIICRGQLPIISAFSIENSKTVGIYIEIRSTFRSQACPPPAPGRQNRFCERENRQFLTEKIIRLFW